MIRNLLKSMGMLALLAITCCSSSAEEPKPETKRKLTIMSYNIHHGAPADVDVINLENIANVIRKSGAEIIALQEVDVKTDRSNKIDQAKELATLLKMHYYFSKSIDYKNGEYGNVILSKYPLTNMRRLELPMTVPGEKRSIALATVELPNGKTIDFGSTHFDLQASREDQAKFLNELNKNTSLPLFIGGDFNATPDSPEMLILKQEFTFSCKGACPFTIPVSKPTKAIDFIVYNNLARQSFTLLSGIAMTGQYASDHLPIVAVYQYD